VWEAWNSLRFRRIYFWKQKESDIYFEVEVWLLLFGPHFFRNTMTRGSFLINKHTERLVRSGKGPTRAPDRPESCVAKKKEGNSTEKETDEVESDERSL
jgi:hypothetical protein